MAIGSIIEGINNKEVYSRLSTKYNNKKKNNNKLNESLFDVIKGDEVLLKEYFLLEGVRKTKIVNEVILKEFIEHNLSMFDEYSMDRYNESRSKIDSFRVMSEGYGSDVLSEHLSNMIEYRVSGFDIKDSSKYFESYEYVFNYIKNNEYNNNNSSLISESFDNEGIFSDEVIFNKVKEIYSKRYINESTEGSHELLKSLLNFDLSNEKVLYEAHLDTFIDSLKTSLNEDENKGDVEYAELINETIKRLSGDEFKYNPDTVVDNLIKINELR